MLPATISPDHPDPLAIVIAPTGEDFAARRAVDHFRV